MAYIGASMMDHDEVKSTNTWVVRTGIPSPFFSLSIFLTPFVLLSPSLYVSPSLDLSSRSSSVCSVRMVLCASRRARASLAGLHRRAYLWISWMHINRRISTELPMKLHSMWWDEDEGEGVMEGRVAQTTWWERCGMLEHCFLKSAGCESGQWEVHNCLWLPTVRSTFHFIACLSLSLLFFLSVTARSLFYRSPSRTMMARSSLSSSVSTKSEDWGKHFLV